MTFQQQIDAWARKTNQSTNQVVVRTCASIAASVILKTPTWWRDGGHARGNWIPSIGNYVGSPVDTEDESGRATIAKAKRTALNAPGNVFYIVNNLSYIGILEYGGYPKTVKLGSWRPDKGIYEVRSIGGYSVQAPQGMVGLTVREFHLRLKEAIREL